MGWVFAFGLVLVALLGLWKPGGLRPGALQLAAAGLLLALVGYAWQGNPSLPGRPTRAKVETKAIDSDFSRTRETVLGRFDRASQWLTIADGYLRRGDTRNAVGIIRSGLRSNPSDPDLWVGLGNALVMHSEGLMTPAAELAFLRAAELAPGHPGPRFYYGMALIPSGRFADTERIWTELLEDAPADASWRPLIEQRLAILKEVRAITEGRRPPPTAPGSPAPQTAPPAASN